MNTTAVARTSEWKQARRLSAILCFSQIAGALGIYLALTRLQRLPGDVRTAVAVCAWVGVALTVIVGLCWAPRLPERQRLARVQAAAGCLVVLDAVLLAFVIRVTGGFLRSPFGLLLAEIPIMVVILRSRPAKGWSAFAVQFLLIIAELWHWLVANATTASRYVVFTDPGFPQTFTILAVFVLLLSVFSLASRRAEMADMAANAFFAGSSRISYAERMGRRD